MPTYWNAFMDEYEEDTNGKDLILILQAFFYYCNGQKNRTKELMGKVDK